MLNNVSQVTIIYELTIPLGSSFIYTADNQPHEVKGTGIVTLLLHNGTDDVTVRLHALHVPSLGQTLVSLTSINRKGQIEFHLSKNGTPTLLKNDVPCADVRTTQNGLLLLSGHISIPGKVGGDIAPHGMALTVGTDWHLRLGHPGLTMMHAMSKKGLIPPLTKGETTTIAKCEVCCASKMAQSPHKADIDENQTFEKWIAFSWTLWVQWL